MPRKVRFVHVALTERWELTGKALPESHIVAVDSRGRLWERYSLMGEGKWGQLEAPDDANSQSKRRVRKR